MCRIKSRVDELLPKPNAGHSVGAVGAGAIQAVPASRLKPSLPTCCSDAAGSASSNRQRRADVTLGKGLGPAPAPDAVQVVAWRPWKHCRLGGHQEEKASGKG